mmetsp:Transcript_20820/g.34412  ORF Transcript_20820/g.34412 Transcript_20820/m.34412 type:complete len:352 (+) Transcript_20820:259-1314(+)|eukprot:CAMPEP_0119004382 /NCGR_PEP_ID=MMETSP1176-20130426/1109_1 /TAXON_ID=265551 /ORGANISM="Synedropsis recta cf, Strain CCMP1620" /LENGTH=351 /DNA_ID=CAMNT_0006956077 /DNA_START=228 /DNA_END=1283 /DNA_ORIENTATION=+
MNVNDKVPTIAEQDHEVVVIPSNGQHRITFGLGPVGEGEEDFSAPPPPPSSPSRSDRVRSLFLSTGSTPDARVTSNRKGLKKEPSLFFQRVDINKRRSLHKNASMDSIALNRSVVVSKKDEGDSDDGTNIRAWCSVSNAIRACFVATLVGVMIYLLVIFVLDVGKSKDKDDFDGGYPMYTRSPPPSAPPKEPAAASTKIPPSSSPVLTPPGSSTTATEPPMEESLLVTEDTVDSTESLVFNTTTEDEIEPPKSIVSDDQPPGGLIGFVEAPLDPEELALLVETNQYFDVESGPKPLDTSMLTETTTETGNTIYCYATVDGIPVSVECIAGESLCRVYVGGSSSDKCTAQFS